MKRMLLTLTTITCVLALVSPAALADPDWGFTFGFGGSGFRMRGSVGLPHPVFHAPYRVVRPARMVHVHSQVPIYRQVWVAPRYETVFAGYNRCGFPIWRTVCVSPGHTESVFVGYRCDGCDHRF